MKICEIINTIADLVLELDATDEQIDNLLNRLYDIRDNINNAPQKYQKLKLCILECMPDSPKNS